MLFVLPLLIKSLDVSAEVEITKVSALTGRAFFGDTIPARVVQAGVPTSFNFTYFDSYTMPSVGLNVATDSIISSPSQMETYDLLIYKATGFTNNVTLDYILLDDFYLRFGDYARGGFALSNFINDSATIAWNDARNYPDNFCGSFPAVRANSDASANLANYYGVMYFQFLSGYNPFTFRPIYYNFDTGGVLDSLSFSEYGRTPENGQGVFYLCIICPYIGSSMSGEPPAETTTSISTSPSTNIDVNVSVYVDNSGIESQLNEYLGADDTRITTYETINLGTFPTFDYDNATETVNISQVVSETGDGINSIWYLISGLFSSVPVLVWLVPFCIFMSIMSFVLWRKGG